MSKHIQSWTGWAVCNDQVCGQALTDGPHDVYAYAIFRTRERAQFWLDGWNAGKQSNVKLAVRPVRIQECEQGPWHVLEDDPSAVCAPVRNP